MNSPASSISANGFGSTPHGGKLVSRLLSAADAQQWQSKLKSLKTLALNDREISDVEMIANGGFSPIRGFMGKKDYQGVVESMRLADGTVWSIPVTLSATQEEAQNFKEGDAIGLLDKDQELLAVLHLKEK